MIWLSEQKQRLDPIPVLKLCSDPSVKLLLGPRVAQWLSTRLQHVWSGSKSRHQCHMWLGLLLVLSFASRGFFSGTPVFPSRQKPTLPNSNLIWNARTRLNQFIWTRFCFVVKRAIFFKNLNQSNSTSISRRTTTLYKLLLLNIINLYLILFHSFIHTSFFLWKADASFPWIGMIMLFDWRIWKLLPGLQLIATCSKKLSFPYICLPLIPRNGWLSLLLNVRFSQA